LPIFSITLENSSNVMYCFSAGSLMKLKKLSLC
jgi:hypothetical protein